jgi:hypothetical protein
MLVEHRRGRVEERDHDLMFYQSLRIRRNNGVEYNDRIGFPLPAEDLRDVRSITIEGIRYFFDAETGRLSHVSPTGLTVVGPALLPRFRLKLSGMKDARLAYFELLPLHIMQRDDHFVQEKSVVALQPRRDDEWRFKTNLPVDAGAILEDIFNSDQFDAGFTYIATVRDVHRYPLIWMRLELEPNYEKIYVTNIGRSLWTHRQYFFEFPGEQPPRRILPLLFSLVAQSIFRTKLKMEMQALEPTANALLKSMGVVLFEDQNGISSFHVDDDFISHWTTFLL